MAESDQQRTGASEAPRGRPIPVPDALSAPYWAAAADHVLTVARCSVCGQTTLPPDIICPHCHSTAPDFTFVPVSGCGHIRTWTVIHRSFLRGFESPYVLVDIELSDQPHIRMIGRLLDGAGVPLRIGLPVEVAFEDVAPKVSVPGFRLEKAA